MGEPIDSFLQEPSDSELVESGYMECRGEFSNQKNREKIFNLFDAYCDTQELVKEEKRENDI